MSLSTLKEDLVIKKEEEGAPSRARLLLGLAHVLRSQR